ncbi:AsmA family protein [Fluviispira multicolorata]|uniref:AsmA family protein n=1 Tax=Fluviispira multicolorata TaxID=2654512 RepID=A0A833N727_9BACT|nr:AsmA family protein [Fluviispira multicolorata]KAB8031750.1 AsmA family protein [Fluviispira multicolorata]
MSTQKKWLIGISSFFLVIFLILIALPFMIDFNKFKPQIQNAVEQRLNAKVNFSSARLTIFSGLGVNLQNVTLDNTDENFFNTQLLRVKDVKFKIDLLPLLQGKIIGEIAIKNPEITVVKNGNKTNLSNLIKRNSNNSSSDLSAYAAENTSSEINSNLSSLSKRVVVKTLSIHNATFVFSSASGAYDREIAKVKDLNVLVSNIGLDRDTKIEIFSDIDINSQEYSVKGPISLKIIANTEMSSNEWKSTIFSGLLSLDKLDINFRDAFVKNGKTSFNLNFGGIAKPQNIMIEDFKFLLHTLNGRATISLDNFQKLNSDIKIFLNSSDLSDMGIVFPQHKKMLLNASVDMITKVFGSLSQPNQLNLNIDLSSKLADSDLTLALATDSIKPLNGLLRVQSKNLKLGDIVKPFLVKTPPLPTKKIEEKEKKPVAISSVDSEEFSLSENEKRLLADSDFSTEINIGNLSYDDLIFNNFSFMARIKHYSLAISKLNMNAFSGSLSSILKSDLGASPINFSGNIALNKVRIEEIAHFVKADLVKSPLDGITDINMLFNGTGTTRPNLSKTLNAKGSFFFYNGFLNTKSLLALAGEQFNNFISNTSFGALKVDSSTLKKLSLSEDETSKKNLNNVKGDFEVKDGKLLVRNSIDGDDGLLKLNGDVGLDETLRGTAIFTASKKTKEKLLQQSKYAKYFLDESGNFVLNMTLGGTVLNPEVFLDTALLQARFTKNGTKELSTKIKEEINKNPKIQKLQENAKKFLEMNGINLNKLGL